MKAARCLWTVGLIVVGMTPLAAKGQGSSDTSNGMHGAAGTEASQSPWSWVKLPKVTMPKIAMPKVSMPKMPADPLAPIKSSAHKVSDGTKKAWEGTKEMFTFGGSKSSTETSTQGTSHSSSTAAPSIWKRMFGGGEETREPQTVADWMAQKRVD